MESRKNTDGGAGLSVLPAAAGTQHTGVSAGTFTAGTVNVYQGAPSAEGGATAGPRCDIPVLYDRRFIERVDLLNAIAETFDDPQRPSVVLLHGPPGAARQSWRMNMPGAMQDAIPPAASLWMPAATRR